MKYQLKTTDCDDLELSLKALSNLAFENSKTTQQETIATIVKNIDTVFTKTTTQNNNVVLEADNKLISKFKTNYNKLKTIAFKICELDDFALEDIKNLTTEIDSYIQKAKSPIIEYINPIEDKTGMFVLSDVVVNGKNISKLNSNNKHTKSKEPKVR